MQLRVKGEWSSRILKDADPIRHISLKELYETL